MTMISYYDFCKLGLLWQANATAFQAAQLAAHVQHTSEGQEFIGLAPDWGKKSINNSRVKSGEEPNGVNHQEQRKHPPTIIVM